MALPTFVARSYAGAAVPAPLSAEITSGALIIGLVTPLVGWVEVGTTNPLGTSGPFVVAVDYGQPSEEKVLCTGLNPDTGALTVYDSGGSSGRGYDGTLAQSHVAGGASPAFTKPVWTATEAEEANDAVTGTLGAVTTAGDLLVGSGANALERLAAGTAGSLLTTNATPTPAWLAAGARGGTLVINPSLVPVWKAIGANGTFLKSDGADSLWASVGSAAVVAADFDPLYNPSSASDPGPGAYSQMLVSQVPAFSGGTVTLALPGTFPTGILVAHLQINAGFPWMMTVSAGSDLSHVVLGAQRTDTGVSISGSEPVFGSVWGW